MPVAVFALAGVTIALAIALIAQQILHTQATERREKEWALERGALLKHQADLLVHIQAPKVAVQQHVFDPAPAVQPGPYGVDQAEIEAQEKEAVRQAAEVTGG